MVIRYILKMLKILVSLAVEDRYYFQDGKFVMPVGKWTKMVMMGGGLMQRLAQVSKN
jgi:hypothetical protein